MGRDMIIQKISRCRDCNIILKNRYAKRCLSCNKKYYWKCHTELKRIKQFCKKCRKELSVSATYNKNKFCKSCAQTGVLNQNWSGGLPKCLDCGIQLKEHQSKYCLKCMHKGKRNPRFGIREYGEKSPNWQGGKSLLIKLIASLKIYEVWRTKCFKRDNYTCQICNKSESGKLNVHHKITLSNLLKIYNIRDIISAIKCKMLWNIRNGITLCTKCHAKTHGKWRKHEK